MNQASSNSNMPRATAEALKQIQKQGLSISIVPSTDSSRSSFPLDSTVSKEMKPKQNVTIDKNPKLPPRSSIATENKATLSQARSVPNSSAETRASSGQPLSTNQSSFQETKMPGNINKSVTPISTSAETRAFGSQSWSNPPLGENKVQGSSNRASQSVLATPENKSQTFSGRLVQSSAAFSEKIQTTRAGQSISQLTDNKSQSKISQVLTVSEPKNQSSHNRSQLSFEGKVQPANRMAMGSPPLEVKAVNSNQGRSSQNFSGVVHENKSSAGPRTINQMLNNQTKVNASRSAEMKTPNQIRVNQVIKNPVERIRPGGKSFNESSPVTTERSLNNPFRVASTLGKKMSTSSEEKSVVKVTRVSSQNVSVVPESQTAVNSKISQNMSMQSESKAVSQVVKVSSQSSELSQKSSLSFDNSPHTPVTPGISSMSSPRGLSGKRPQFARVATSVTPVAKKKCTKRNSPNTTPESSKKHLQTSVDPASFSSDEGSPKDKQFFNMKGLTPGLTITPVNANVASVSIPTTSGNTTKAAVSGATSTAALCPSCHQLSLNMNNCTNCHTKIPTSVQTYTVNNAPDALSSSSIVTKFVTTTSVQKQIVYQFSEATSQNQSFHFQQAVQGKVMVETPVIQMSPRTKGRPKTRRKFVEPVCYTLSSDEEEPVQVPFHPVLEEASHLFPVESEGSKSEHSSGSEVLQDENQEFDDPQFPGVTDINEHVEVEEPDEEEEMEYEGEGMDEEEELDESIEEEEEEEVVPEEPEIEDTHGQMPTDYPLRCRSVRIGAYKVHPAQTRHHVHVVLSMDSISFQAPVLTDPLKFILITIRNHDITRVLVHFGRCLPIMYVYTTAAFGEAVRNALHMSQADPRYFNPMSKDDKTQKLTFLIDSMTEEQKTFIRQCFPGDKKVKEIDQKQANEILVKSTPNQSTAFVKLHSNETVVIPASNENPVIQIANAPSQLSVTKIIVPPQPVIKLLTYPPPPQTGGIAITSEDLLCLNEGEFLNDVIIDFYLKYIFNDKLTQCQRDKTHIFSSYFYPRLTHKPERPRPGDDTPKTAQMRRHNQVKTWTRHVDIFSKDFIIIPVNQNVHWFLAIICYPGRVPDAPISPIKTECKGTKSNDNVTSTVEQENGCKVIIKEISSNGEGDENQDENSMNSSINSPYLVEEPPDSDEASPETPDSSTHPDGKQGKEMPCICIFDSLSGPSRWRIPTTLREYLEMEWKMKKGTKKVFDRTTMQGFVMKCPQQTNFSDCGTYLLQFVESFFENPIPYFGNPMPDLTNWFSESKIAKKRQQLKDLILHIHKMQVASANARRPNQSEGVPSSPATAQQTDNR